MAPSTSNVYQTTNSNGSSVSLNTDDVPKRFGTILKRHIERITVASGIRNRLVLRAERHLYFKDTLYIIHINKTPKYVF